MTPPTIATLQKQIDQLQEQLDVMKETLEQVEAAKWVMQEPGEWKPGNQEKYWYLDYRNGAIETVWTSYSLDYALLNTGNCFPTEESATAEKMRREARSKRWLPKEGEEYWTYSRYRILLDLTWDGDLTDWESYHIGDCHKTREEAEAWAAKYLPYFLRA